MRRRCGTWLWSGLTVLVLAAPSGAGEPNRPQAAWRALMAGDAKAATAGKRLDAVLDACAGQPSRVKALIATDAAYEPLKPGRHARKLKFTGAGKARAVDLTVRLPRRYTPKSPWPVLLAAHGQYGSGATIVRMMELLLGRDVERYVVVAPTLPGPKHFNGRPYQGRTYLQSLAWARRCVNVDDDRIVVSGYSQGAHVSWHLATMHPRLFAAAAPLAGVPWFEGSPYTNNSYLENLAHLPLWAVWGEKDTRAAGVMSNVHFARLAARRLGKLGHKHFTGTELKGVGHAGCWPRPPALARYFAKHKRRPMPKAFAHFFHRPHHARGYYLQALKFTRAAFDFTKKVAVPLGPDAKDATDEQIVQAVAYRLNKYLFKLSGALDTKANALSIRTLGISAVRVYVMEGMFDLARPVTLKLNGRTWRGRVPVSARCLLTHYARTRDATALIVNELDIDAAGKVTVRHKPRGQ